MHFLIILLKLGFLRVNHKNIQSIWPIKKKDSSTFTVMTPQAEKHPQTWTHQNYQRFHTRHMWKYQKSWERVAVLFYKAPSSVCQTLAVMRWPYKCCITVRTVVSGRVQSRTHHIPRSVGYVCSGRARRGSHIRQWKGSIKSGPSDAQGFMALVKIAFPTAQIKLLGCFPLKPCRIAPV